MNERERGGDRPKKSWRDVDAQRDRSRAASSGPGTGGGRPEREDDRSSKQHRAALEALFAKGEFGKLADKLANPGALRAQAPGVAPTGHSSAHSAGNGAPGGNGAGAGDGGGAPARAPAVAPSPPAADATPRIAARKKILDAVGRDQVSRAVDKYVAEFGWPADYEALEQALDHTREERQIEVMDALDRLLAKEKPRRSRTLAGKLRTLEETSHDGDVRTRASLLRARLG